MDLPLLADPRSERPFAWRRGAGISVGTFLAEVQALAERLPDSPHVLNQCQDRYRFLVGLGAAMRRGQVSLFPSARAPEALARLRRDFPGVYCLSDEAGETPEGASGMALFAYPAFPPLTGAGGAACPAFPPDRIVAMAFTSGSTGEPKRHAKTWGSFMAEARGAGLSLGLPATGGACLAATVPPQHMYGFIASILLPLAWGLSFDTGQPFFPEDIRATLTALPGPAILVTNPVQLRACLLEDTALPPMAFILSSTAPLAVGLAAQAERRFQAPVLEFYGSTETGAMAFRRPVETDIWRTFEGVTVSLRPEGFRVAADYFAPMVLSDSVEVRNPREFRLFGRAADVVKVGGRRITLGELNTHLLAIEGVQDGAFYLPDATEGEVPRPAALVVAPGLTAAQLLEALRERIDPLFLPRPLRLVERLPRNATGKLPREGLLRLHRPPVADGEDRLDGRASLRGPQ